MTLSALLKVEKPVFPRAHMVYFAFDSYRMTMWDPGQLIRIGSANTARTASWSYFGPLFLKQVLPFASFRAA
jgi:hypothetical protein